MKDPRIDKLAKILVDYSTGVKKGDVVSIEFSGAAPLPLVTAIHGLCLDRGAKTVEVSCSFPEIKRSFFDHASDTQLRYFPKHKLDFMKKVDVFIGVRGDSNSKALASVESKRLSTRAKTLWPITECRVNKTRWVVLLYPTEGMAQEAGMALHEFEDFVFKACLRDWAKTSASLAKLEKLLTKTKEVRLVAGDTDLRFAKKGIPAIKCDGKMNMPDGEVFTAPERTSAEGHIKYNTPSNYHGREFDGVRLVFKKGKIVETSCDKGDQAALDEIFNTDPGARYIGEFAIGCNQGIDRAVKEILFDEKIGGSIHLTPGACYEEAPNGNKSAVHWDLVKILKGDGAMYFDGKLVQKNGKFLLSELKALNR